MKFAKNEKIGDIVTRFPMASEVFQEYKIDYCCGGHKTLSEIAYEENVDINPVLLDLENLYKKVDFKKSVDWTSADLTDLVNHILQEHHAFLHMNLPLLSDLIKTILRVHGSNHPELLELYQNFQSLKTELEVHLIKEETIQYPAIKEYLETLEENDLNKAISVIEELEDEHEVAGNLLKKINHLTGDFQTPSDGCETFERTYNLLDELEKNTFSHIHLENNILFPRLKNLK